MGEPIDVLNGLLDDANEGIERLQGENESLRATVERYQQALEAQVEYLKRLKHRAKVRGGPDTSAMGIADEAIEAIASSLPAPLPATPPQPEKANAV